MFCSNCGAQLSPAAAFCTACGSNVATEAPALAQQEQVSLTKPSASTPPPLPPIQAQGIPEGVKGWSWGAFLLNWIWAIGNRTWIGLLALVPYVGLIVAIWLGFKGREMAWKNAQWDSVEHFQRVQKKWSRWGVGLTLGFLVLGILAAIAIPAYQDYATRSQQMQSDASLDRLLADVQETETETQIETETETEAATAAPASERGSIDSNADTLPTSLTTVAGTLTRIRNQEGNRVVTLDGEALFSGEDANWQFPVRRFALSDGKEAVLMASSGGRGNSCETLFFFLMADASGVKPTPLFGSCSPQGSFEQDGDTIVLTLPEMGGQSTIVLRDGTLIENGEVLAMNDNNDPSK